MVTWMVVGLCWWKLKADSEEDVVDRAWHQDGRNPEFAPVCLHWHRRVGRLDPLIMLAWWISYLAGRLWPGARVRWPDPETGVIWSGKCKLMNLRSRWCRSGFLPISRGKCRGHLLDLLSIRLAIDENKLVGHGYKRSAESRMENQLYKWTT